MAIILLHEQRKQSVSVGHRLYTKRRASAPRIQRPWKGVPARGMKGPWQGHKRHPERVGVSHGDFWARPAEHLSNASNLPRAPCRTPGGGHLPAWWWLCPHSPSYFPEVPSPQSLHRKHRDRLPVKSCGHTSSREGSSSYRP